MFNSMREVALVISTNSAYPVSRYIRPLAQHSKKGSTAWQDPNLRYLAYVYNIRQREVVAENNVGVVSPFYGVCE